MSPNRITLDKGVGRIPFSIYDNPGYLDLSFVEECQTR